MTRTAFIIMSLLAVMVAFPALARDAAVDKRFFGIKVPAFIEALAIKEARGGTLNEVEKADLADADAYYLQSRYATPVCQMKDLNADAKRGKSRTPLTNYPECTSKLRKQGRYRHIIGVMTPSGQKEDAELYYVIDEVKLKAVNQQLRATEAKWREREEVK